MDEIRVRGVEVDGAGDPDLAFRTECDSRIRLELTSADQSARARSQAAAATLPRPPNCSPAPPSVPSRVQLQ